ncbi:MAG: class I SAM-dependent methyltransferase [Thermoguttaceae bacterium]
MSFLAELKTLYCVALKRSRGGDAAERVEAFYQGQAENFDNFRGRLLHGRRELFAAIAAPPDGIWVDMGGGTGWNLEQLGRRIDALGRAYIVDLSPSMLKVARRRIQQRDWKNVEAVEADATAFRPPKGQADVVTFSYSLTMIPDWFAAIDNAFAILKPGGVIGALDFYVARKHPGERSARHGFFGHNFWPLFFSLNDVFPSPDHLPYLRRRFAEVHCSESRGRVPYLPLLRAPYYTFIGKKTAE